MKIKNIIFLIFLSLTFILNMNIVCAEIYRGTITGTGVRLRSGAGTNYDAIKDTSKGNIYTLVSNTLYPSEQGCERGWYNIYYEESASGYVCSDYVEVVKIEVNETPDNDCEVKLKNLGFPSTYWGGLCSLNNAHPSWNFVPVFTDLDWSTAVNAEAACGKSYIQSSLESNIDSSCKNPYSSGWYPASSKALAYYMDPRNWFSEKYIFQFEYTGFNNNLNDIYPSAANSSVSNTSFYQYYVSKDINLGNILTDAGRIDGVNPVFLAARMRMELGNKDRLYNLYSGVYSDYDGIYYGYYNLFNIGVSDSCATTYGTSYCGLKHAASKGWNSVYNAARGGTSLINNYINVGQNTNYFQKFNVNPTKKSSLYTHQYMTNIAAPSSESSITYNAYKNSNTLDGAFTFYIPVYNNIDNSLYNSSSGAVDDTSNSDPITTEINTIITSSGYKTSGEYLTGVAIGKTISDLKSDIESIAGNGNVKVLDKNGNYITDGKIGTGNKVVVNNANGSKTFTVVVRGDTSGDGKIDALDLLQVRKNILGTYTLNNEYQRAGDTSGDGKIDALDLLQVRKNILGSYKIIQ